MGPVQSTSSVVFFGIEIIGELCADKIDIVAAWLWNEMVVERRGEETVQQEQLWA